MKHFFIIVGLFFGHFWSVWPHLNACVTACLRSAKVRLHVGPGNQYPVDWIFICKGLPVLILSEFDQWRRIRTEDKTEGWVHKSLLSFKKTYLVIQDSFLLSRPSLKSKKIACVLSGNIVNELKNKGPWVKIALKDRSQRRWTGWMERQNFWPR